MPRNIEYLMHAQSSTVSWMLRWFWSLAWMLGLKYFIGWLWISGCYSVRASSRVKASVRYSHPIHHERSWWKIVLTWFNLWTYFSSWFLVINDYFCSLPGNSCAHMDDYSQSARSIKHTFLKFFACCLSRTKEPIAPRAVEVRSKTSFNSHRLIDPINKLSELPSGDIMTTSSHPVELVANLSILNNGTNSIIKTLFSN